MSAVAASMEHRARVLRALGVMPWRRRVQASVDGWPEVPITTVDDETSASIRCVVLLPAGCAVRELDLLGRACGAYGVDLARAARIEVGNAPLVDVPQARGYLVFGEAQAHALGRVLSAEAMQQAHIVLADAPTDVLANAASKRRLWSALRSLRRALAAAGH